MLEFPIAFPVALPEPTVNYCPTRACVKHRCKTRPLWLTLRRATLKVLGKEARQARPPGRFRRMRRDREYMFSSGVFLMSKSFLRLSALALILALILSFSAAPAAAQGGEKWCAGKTIRFFAGGAEGDAFGSIVQRGASGRRSGSRRDGRIHLLWLGRREDDPAAPRSDRRQARRHRHDGPSRRRCDHAAGRRGRRRPAS